MVYEAHKSWREHFGLSRPGHQDIPDSYKSEFKKLLRRKVTIPYTIEVECNSYWGNFEREFIGYCMGVLDDVQMNIDFAEEQRILFWWNNFPDLMATTAFKKGEEFELPNMEWCLENYELLKDFLLETLRDVDDWYQLTFYGIDWDALHGTNSHYLDEKKNILYIQLAKPLTPYWENIIVPRMKLFFQQKIYKWMKDDTKLISIKLYDKEHNLVKEY